MPPPQLFFVSILLSTTLAHAAPGVTDWNAAARQDMQFAINTIHSSHAGAVSGQLDVTVPLESGASVGMIEAAKVKTEQDYRRAMVRFIDGFGDPHTNINLKLKIQAWTGIVLDHVDGQFRVIWTEPNWPQALPPRGAIVQSCDDVWIGSYLKNNVAPFINHSPEYATSASDAARQTMFDLGLGWTPKQCIFTLADGSSRPYQLPLRALADGIGDERIQQVTKSYMAKGRPVGLYPLAAGMHWIAMPTFYGSIPAAAYEQLYPQLAALKKSDWVVFDLRGNGGGDSSWGNRALQALYGKEYGTSLGDTAAYSERIIADPATSSLYRRYASLPEYAASKGQFEDMAQKLETAFSHGEKMAVVDGRTREQAVAQAAQLRQRPGGPRVAAVIDRNCFSSCMNFVQQISSMADTVLLGEPTIGYSPYGEINRFNLPSGNGSIALPSAVFQAFQATREPFVPDLPYPGNMADEAALMTWVATTLTHLKPGMKH